MAAARCWSRVLQVEDIPPLPDLAGLWERESRPGDDAYNEELAHDLASAEVQLSAYRNCLASAHLRLDRRTDCAVPRRPGLCLLALPADQREEANRRTLAARR